MKKLICLTAVLMLVLGSISAQAGIDGVKKWAEKVKKLKEMQAMASPAPEASAQSWVCENCGQQNEGNFCGNCGAARPSVAWTCPSCGQQNEGNFCGNCGTARPSSSPTQIPTPAPAPESGSDAPVLNTRTITRMIPEVFADNLNYYTGVVAPMLFKSMSAEDIAKIRQYVSVTYTEAVGDAVYYNNVDWNVEVSCFFYDDAPDKDRPADEVSINYPTDLDAGLITLLQIAMALSSKDVDPSVDSNEITDWMQGDRKTGDEFQLTGCYLAVMIDNGRCQYSLIRKAL